MANMKVALVTGGTRGIGKEISLELQTNGYRVIANYHKNHEMAKEFQNKTGIFVASWDVANHGETMQAIDQLTQDLGLGIDILVNNAGIIADSMMHKMKEGDWDSVITTNLSSCFNVTRAVINGMRERSFGRVINISSINGQAGQIGQTNYAAAKAGVIGFTKALALENANKNITANVIAPGYIATDMLSNIDDGILEKIISKIPAKRLGEASEISRAVLFLASENAGFINGAVLNINGGQYM